VIYIAEQLPYPLRRPAKSSKAIHEPLRFAEKPAFLREFPQAGATLASDQRRFRESLRGISIAANFSQREPPTDRSIVSLEK